MRGEPVPRNGQKDEKKRRSVAKVSSLLSFLTRKVGMPTVGDAYPPPFCLLRHSCTGAEDAAGRKTERFWERSPRLRK